jgi:flagellar basal-body rod protein FlgC
MDMTDSMAVSVTALDAQRQRLNVISSNLANAQSTHTPGGGPYKRRDVVFQSTPVASPFQRTFRQVSTGPGAHSLDGVKVLRVQEDKRPGRSMIRAIRMPTRKGLSRCRTSTSWKKW